MERRSLGHSSIEVSVIGFGAWGIGGLTPNATSYGKTDDTDSRRALEAAFERGINFFDSAAAYGNGHSERLIGETFAARRGDVVIATKGGIRRFDEPADFSPDTLHQTLLDSLARLRSDYVDLYQLHSPPASVFDAPGALNALFDKWRSSGIVRSFGVSVATPEEGLVALKCFDVDALQVNFNLLDQRMLDCGLMAEAEARSVSIIARTPLCFGFLSGAYRRDTRFDDTDHRSKWPVEQIDRWIDAADQFFQSVQCAGTASPAQIALRYCLSFPAISTTIPGMMNENEVFENAAAAEMGPLTPDQLTAVRQIYRKESFFVGGG